MKTHGFPLISATASLICVLAFLVATGLAAGPTKKVPEKTAAASCNPCHNDLNKVVPRGHEAVTGKDLSACLKCHKPELTGKAAANGFSANLHLGHIPPKGAADCMVCHSLPAGKRFGIRGVDRPLGVPSKEDLLLIKDIVGSLAKNEYTALLHAQKGVMCVGCHGNPVPRSDEKVENRRCLECHGPEETLSRKTEPKELKDRNPHKSHLGEIACTVCHKAHQPSNVYCLDCHKTFQMKIRGSSKR